MAEEITFFGELDRLSRQEPFERFLIFTSDGMRYDIDGRNTLTLFATYVTVVSLSGIIYIPMSHISRFEIPEPLAGDEGEPGDEDAS